MTYEELYQVVFDELGDQSGQAAYDAVLLRTLAPLLHSHEAEKFKFLMCPDSPDEEKV